MANIIKHSVLSALTTYLSTDLNALADGGKKIGDPIDNTSDRNTTMEVELFLAEQGVARDSGAYVDIYLLKSLDGTNYSFGGDARTPSASDLIKAVAFDAAVTEGRVTVEVSIPPLKFKFLIVNNTGQALAATLNTVKYGTHNPEIQ